jgi:hypothetical protein
MMDEYEKSLEYASQQPPRPPRRPTLLLQRS